MTREEIKKAMHDTKREIVIKNLYKLLSLVEGYPEYEDCISYAIAELEQEPVLEIKTVTNAEEAEAYPISENITKGFEEFTKMMFKQGLVESEGKE